MNNISRWIEENRPSDDPDYQRVAKATELIEGESGGGDENKVLGRRFDFDVALKYSERRIEETSHKVKRETPDWETLQPLLVKSWVEGFAFGSLVYMRERRGRQSEALLDRIAIANANNLLATSDQEETNALYQRIMSSRTLGFVALVRSVKAYQVADRFFPVLGHQQLKTTLGGHWVDGFLLGIVFQELGGHREQG